MCYRVVFLDEMGAYGEEYCQTLADAKHLQRLARAKGKDARIEKLG